MTSVDTCIKMYISFGPFEKSQLISNQHHISASDCLPTANIVALGTFGESGRFNAQAVEVTTGSGAVHRLQPESVGCIEGDFIDSLYDLLGLSDSADDYERADCIDNLMIFPTTSNDPSASRIFSVDDGDVGIVPRFRANGSESSLNDVRLFATCDVISITSVPLDRVIGDPSPMANSPLIQSGASQSAFAVVMMSDDVREDFSGARTEPWTKAALSEFVRVPDPVLRVQLIGRFCGSFSQGELWDASEESIGWLDHRSEVFWGNAGPSEKGFDAVTVSFAVYILFVLSRFHRGTIMRAPDGHLAFVGNRSGAWFKPVLWVEERFLQNRPLLAAYREATKRLECDRR